jgi:hypothetical protein
MTRDPKIKEIFEIADDSLHGLLGYSLYTYAAFQASQVITKEEIKKRLPKALPMTHEWVRFYDPDELISVVSTMNPDFLARSCLVTMVSTFEVALGQFVECLDNSGHQTGIAGRAGYKACQGWAFTKVANSDWGTPAMQARIPDLCVHAEHGRRVRNLYMHNRGMFDTTYGTDVVPIQGRANEFHPEYQRWMTNQSQMILYPLKYFDYLGFSKSHIELLHCLHYEIQKQEFGDTSGYDYKKEGKGIIWNRLLRPS